MKKNGFTHLVILLIVSVFFICGHIGCSTDEQLLEQQVSKFDILNQYREACKRWSEKISEEMEELENLSIPQSRFIPSYDTVGYLLSLSDDDFDKTLEAYNVDRKKPLIDENGDLKIDTLIDFTSAEEVKDLYNYINYYVSEGGHSEYLVEQYSRSVKSSIIREVVINASAYYDQITSSETAALLSGNTELENSAQDVCA